MRIVAISIALSLAGCGGAQQRAHSENAQKPTVSQAVEQGEYFFSRGEFDRALTVFEQAVIADADDERAWLDLGLTREALGDVSGAESAYRKAIAVEPAFPEALNNLGVLRREQGDLNEAEQYLRRALSARHAFSDAHFNLAMTLEDKKSFEDAANSYGKAASLAPRDAMPLLNLGMMQLALGQKDKALVSLRGAVERGGDGRTMIDIGRGLRMAGSPQDAAKVLSLLIEKGHASVQARLELALAHYANGDLNLAIGELQIALRAEPKNATTHYLLGSVYHKQKKPSLAHKYLKKSIALDDAGAHVPNARHRLKSLR